MSNSHSFSLKSKPGFIYAVTLIVCFLVFKQSDLTHTYTSSYAYLNGFFVDFYDYNKIYMGGNDYLPLLYSIFAIWNIPLKLLDLLPQPGIQPWLITSPIEVVWSKLLLVIFFAACVYLLNKITHIISKENEYQGVSAGSLFITSPFVIFTVFIFSQYDIIGVFFTLLGFYFYLNKKFIYFALLFSVAISFKYFAFIIYLPLVLLIEKRLTYLILYILAGWIFTFIQLALYWHSDIFVSGIFQLAGGKAGEGLGRSSTPIFAALYLLGCVYAFSRKVNIDGNRTSWFLNAIFLSAFSYALMFCVVRWHPHWMVILAPFTCLSYLFLRKQNWLACLEIAAYIGFIVLCVNTWERNVDITMALDGVFGKFIPHTDLIGRDILSRKWMGLSRTFFYLYLFAPFLLLAYEKRNFLGEMLQKVLNYRLGGFNFSAREISCVLSPYFFYGRAFAGTLFLGVILLLCIYWPR